MGGTSPVSAGSLLLPPEERVGESSLPFMNLLAHESDSIEVYPCGFGVLDVLLQLAGGVYAEGWQQDGCQDC